MTTTSRTSRHNHPFIVFSCALAAIIVFGGIFTGTRQYTALPRKEPPALQNNGVTFQKETVSKSQILTHANNSEFAYAQGPKNAQVTVVEYFDFQCPFSAQSAQTAQRLIATYQTAPVRFIFRQAPAANVYPASLPASNASLCAHEQGKFLPMYMLLFDQQKKVKEENLSRFADMIELNRAQFDACMNSRKYQKWISKDLSDAIALKLQGTPTWFINGKRFIGAMPFDVLSDVIQKELAAQ
jgi:protein-disulfide isomerase